MSVSNEAHICTLSPFLILMIMVDKSLYGKHHHNKSFPARFFLLAKFKSMFAFQNGINKCIFERISISIPQFSYFSFLLHLRRIQCREKYRNRSVRIKEATQKKKILQNELKSQTVEKIACHTKRSRKKITK